MKNQMYGNHVQRMLQAGKGYRSETIFGDGYTDPVAVSCYETFELGNTDIPDTILSLYKNLLTKEEEALFVAYANPEMSGDAYLKIRFQKSIQKLLESLLGKKSWMCKWLAAFKEDVIKIYGADAQEIEVWKIPENVCVLADLGCDGALFVW